MIDALVISGCLFLTRGRNIGGAVLIGLAAACKGPPLLFAPYLAFRRNWLSAGLVVLVAVGVNLLPDLIIPAPDGQTRLMVWIDRYVMPTFNGQLGGWNGLSVYNQALAGTIQRLFTTTLQWTSSGLSYIPDARRIPEAVIKLSAYGLMLAMLAVSVIAALGGRPAARPDVSGGGLPSQTALEMSGVSILMLLMSPMSDLAHLGTLILPGFCLARLAIFDGSRIIGATMAIALAGALVVNKDLVGETGYTAVLWAGVATWSMVAFWAGCILALAQGRGAPPSDGFARSIFSFPSVTGSPNHPRVTQRGDRNPRFRRRPA